MKFLGPTKLKNHFFCVRMFFLSTILVMDAKIIILEENQVNQNQICVLVPPGVMTITNYYFLYLVVDEACLTHLFLESKYFFRIVSILGIFWNAKLRYKWQYLGFLHGYWSLKPKKMTALRPLQISLNRFSSNFVIECCNILLKHIKKNLLKKKVMFKLRTFDQWLFRPYLFVDNHTP